MAIGMTVGGAIAAIVGAMRVHAEREDVSAAGCAALFNLTWTEREVVARAALDGAGAVVRGAMERFADRNGDIQSKGAVILRALAEPGNWK